MKRILIQRALLNGLEFFLVSLEGADKGAPFRRLNEARATADMADDDRTWFSATFDFELLSKFQNLEPMPR